MAYGARITILLYVSCMPADATKARGKRQRHGQERWKWRRAGGRTYREKEKRPDSRGVVLIGRFYETSHTKNTLEELAHSAAIEYNELIESKWMQIVTSVLTITLLCPFMYYQ